MPYWRYSNNLIGFSEQKDIKLDATEKNKGWLFNNYIAPKTRPEA